MPTALHVRSGPDKGRIFTLDPDRRLHIGRAVNCEVQLTDPVSSRFHAVVYFEDDQWFVHDTGSSNGTQVNGQKIDTAQLVDETIMVIGTTTLQFRRRAEAGETDIDSQNQTIFMDRKMSGVQRDPGLLQAFTSGEGDQADLPVSTQHLLDLLLLSFKLHRTDRVDDCIDTAMQMLHAQTNADVVGFLYDSGNGKLTPERFSPPLSPNESMQLSAKLTHRVTRYGEAIWVNDHGVNSDSAEHVADQARMESQHHHWTDAICVPMMAPLGSDASGNSLGVKDSSGKKPQPSAADIANADSRPVGPQVELDDLEETDGGERSESLVGILHLYRRSKSFTQEAFDFAVTAGSLLGLALARVRRMQSLQAEHQRISDRNAVSDDMIGDSKPMLKLKERILRVGRASGCVLIRGESGAGKELVARAVHQNSPRKERPLLTVNCAAIPSELIESQLFGHKKGAFTGADADHVGWFQQAHTGTLFLDEIGELTLEGQAKLLRILEGHPFLPVGGSKEVSVDVRVVAATNRDLAEFVREKRFREDLYFRLSVFELLVPPLRERGEDIQRLIDHFLQHFRSQHGRRQLQLSENARQRLLEYHWPGNVRQLRNVIDSAVVMADDPQIVGDDLGLRDAGMSAIDTLKIDEWERRLIKKALKRTDGNIPEAAKLLGVSRATAYRKVSEYGIDRN